MAVAEHRFRVMASEVHLVVTGADGTAHDLVAGAREHLEHLERRWSRFLPDSDVSRLNRSSGEPIGVDEATMTLFSAMHEAWRITDGRFDPTVLPALVAAGYGASKEDPGRVTTLPPGAVSGGCMADISIDRGRGTIAVPAEAAVDPGGLGKGLAADLAVARLLDRGAAGALVSIGGDVAMAGEPPEATGWRIAVEQPDRARGTLAPISVSGGGVATSSVRSRCWTAGGRSRHHVIDPATGEPSTTDLASVTVIARSGWLAEAHATAALLSGRSGALGYLSTHRLTGVAFDEDGGILATADVEPLLVRDLDQAGARAAAGHR